MKEQLVNDAAAAKYLGISKQTLRNWRVAGIGPPYIKLQRIVRYDVNDLANYAAQCKVVTDGGGVGRAHN